MNQTKKNKTKEKNPNLVKELRRRKAATSGELFKVYQLIVSVPKMIKTFVDEIRVLFSESNEKNKKNGESLLRIADDVKEIKNRTDYATKSDLLNLDQSVGREVERMLGSRPHWHKDVDLSDIKEVLMFLVKAEVARQMAPETKEVVIGDEEEVRRRIREIWGEEEPELMRKVEVVAATVAQAVNRPGGGGLSRAQVVDLIGGGSGSGGNFTREDLSSQCNGSNKVFTLSNNYIAGSVQVMGTQFPIIYRPTTDFTESAAAEVTLTSAVGAPASGQTLVVIYEADV